PELLAACVAVVAHPDDDRYRDRFGSTVHTPLFGVEVPVVAHDLANPEKGSGIAMICTFGDQTDVLWWRQLGLPLRSIVERDGRIQTAPPPGVPDGEAWRAQSSGTGRSPRTSRRCPWTRPPTPRPATGPTSATGPAASRRTRTSWTPGPRRRCRRRSSPAGRTTPTCSPACTPWTSGR